MRLKFLFYIMSVFLLGIWVLLFFTMPRTSRFVSYLAESLIVLNLLYLVYFYQKVIKPYRMIGNGMELLKEQDFSSRLRTVGQVEADSIVQIFNRMMEQMKNERLHVREQNHFLDLLVKVSPMGVIIFDFDQKITQCNDAAARFLESNSIQTLVGQTLVELDSALAQVLAELPIGATETFRPGDYRVFRCSKLSFTDQGFQHPFVLIESLTSEVILAEKKAYEKVIRMIAHEVNNTTAGITSTLDSVQSTLQDMDGMDDLREVINVCSERCYGMSRFITNFADVVKIPDPNLQMVDLNKEVSSCKIFMENLCNNRHIHLHLKLSDEKLMVNIDTSLFEQALTNIVKNAAESIEQDGDIYIKTSKYPIELEIGDNGKGISKDTEAKLFTPFFSTKPNGQGIGLIFIREVLVRQGCSFSLRTYKDGLTRFKILFSEKEVNAFT